MGGLSDDDLEAKQATEAARKAAAEAHDSEAIELALREFFRTYGPGAVSSRLWSWIGAATNHEHSPTAKMLQNIVRGAALSYGAAVRGKPERLELLHRHFLRGGPGVDLTRKSEVARLMKRELRRNVERGPALPSWDIAIAISEFDALTSVFGGDMEYGRAIDLIEAAIPDEDWNFPPGGDLEEHVDKLLIRSLRACGMTAKTARNFVKAADENKLSRSKANV